MEGCTGLAEAIEKIEALTKETMGVQVENLPGEPGGYYLIVKPDGTVEDRLAKPKWHAETLATPEQLRDFIKEYGEQDKESDPGAIYYDEAGVVFVYDQTDRRHRAACPLKLSEQFLWLRDGSKSLLSQADFVRVLRIALRGCIPDGGSLLALVRQLKFNVGSETDRDLQHGRESMGQSILKQVTGHGAIPEEIQLDIQVFDNFNHPHRIVCAVEVFPAEQRFKLTPYPLELKRVMDLTMEDLGEVFDDENMPPAFRGQP